MLTLEEKMVGFFFFFLHLGWEHYPSLFPVIPSSLNLVLFLHSLLNTQQTKTIRRHSQRKQTQSFREGQDAKTKLPFSHLLRAETHLVIKCQAFFLSFHFLLNKICICTLLYSSLICRHLIICSYEVFWKAKQVIVRRNHGPTMSVYIGNLKMFI